jgi:glycosyltransferase involved in cell wall biosynthesis
VISLHGTYLDEAMTALNRFRFTDSARSRAESVLRAVGFTTYHLTRALPHVRHFDGVFATSNEQRALIGRWFGILDRRRVHLVYNGVPLPKNQRRATAKEKCILRSQYRLPLQDHILIGAARLLEEKGIQFLLESLKLLKAQTERVHLVVLGSGPFAPALCRHTAALGLTDRVTFAGSVQMSELMNYLRLSDVFINPSIRVNGYDLTIARAMAASLPVVVSDVGSVPTLVEHGVSGLTVPAGDVPALARAIKSLVTDEHLARTLGDAALKRILGSFTTNRMAEMAEAAYAETVAQMRRRNT